MPEAATLSRRGFVLSLLGAAGGATLSIWVGGGCSEERRIPVALRLGNMLADISGTERLGKLALAQFDRGVDAETLALRVFPELRTLPPGSLPDDAELEVSIRRRVREDFAQGRVVRLDGWILSSTEARLCALTALAAQ